MLDEYWNNQFQQAVRNIGMEKLAVTVTALCRKYLGLKTPLNWCDIADAQLVDDLMEYIMACGNMGRKGDRGAHSTRTVLHSFRNPLTIARYLANSGRVHWAPARKHAWLAPIACVYQLGHIARKGLSRNANISELMSDVHSSQVESDMLRRLGITRL